MNIALVTDSTSDLPPDLAARHQIEVMPNLLVIDDEIIEDGPNFSRHDFYTRLPEMKTQPTTGTASAGKYQELYRHLLDKGAKAVISIHASGQLSGILNAASSAAVEFGDRVRVIDSLNVSLGLGFQTLMAAEAILSGMMLEPLLAWLAGLRQRVHVVAMLDTLEYVRRSGRVSWARTRLGNFLQIKPFVSVSSIGKVNSLGEARTRSKGTERLRILLTDLGPLEYLGILHTNAEEDARRFLDSLNLQLVNEPLIVNVTTVIGTHVGPNGLGFAAVQKQAAANGTITN